MPSLKRGSTRPAYRGFGCVAECDHNWSVLAVFPVLSPTRPPIYVGRVSEPIVAMYHPFAARREAQSNRNVTFAGFNRLHTRAAAKCRCNDKSLGGIQHVTVSQPVNMRA